MLGFLRMRKKCLPCSFARNKIVPNLNRKFQVSFSFCPFQSEMEDNNGTPSVAGDSSAATGEPNFNDILLKFSEKVDILTKRIRDKKVQFQIKAKSKMVLNLIESWTV